MKFILTVFCFLILVIVDTAPNPVWKLFSGGNSGYNYNNYYGYGYYPRQPRYNYGRSYSGDDRYKSICRVHAVSSLAFPGRIGNPVCP